MWRMLTPPEWTLLEAASGRLFHDNAGGDHLAGIASWEHARSMRARRHACRAVVAVRAVERCEAGEIDDHSSAHRSGESTICSPAGGSEGHVGLDVSIDE